MKNREALKRIYRPVLRNRPLSLRTIIYWLAAGIFPVISVFALEFISGNILNGSESYIFKIAFGYGSLIIFLGVLSQVLRSKVYGDYIYIRLEFMRQQLEKVTKMDYRHYENKKLLDKAETSMEAVGSNNSGIEGVYWKVFELGKFLISSLILGIVVSRASIFIILSLIIILILDFILAKRVSAYEYERRDELSSVSRKLNSYSDIASDFSYGKELRTYDMDGLFKSYFNKNLGEYKGILEDINSLKFRLSPLKIGFIVLGEIVGLFILFKSSNTMEISEVIKYISSINILLFSLRNVFRILAEIRRELLSVRAYFEFMDMDFIEEGGRDIDFKGEPISIEFKDVSFRYPNSDREIYKGLSFKIDKGESLGVVGVNGAGKTTLVKLMTGLYRPTKGKIYYNGIDSEEFTRESKFRMFSPVFQEVNPLALSVGENISGERDFDQNKAELALEEVGLLEKIKSYPEGINSNMLKVLDSQGIVLSGGENQRLLIARAIYKDKSSMLILDEPTASLDALAEEKIYMEFEKLMNKRTSLFISHRLASTRFCDRIMVLDGGQIKELGTHDELLDLDGLYSHMYQVQGSYYKEALDD